VFKISQLVHNLLRHSNPISIHVLKTSLEAAEQASAAGNHECHTPKLSQYPMPFSYSNMTVTPQGIKDF
jgi:hypothetical protein